MGQLSSKAYFVLLARLVLSATLLFAALPKIGDPVAFATSIEGFRLVGRQGSLWVALVLPWLELVVGMGLLIPQIRRGCGILIALLLLLFIGLHISAWMRGLDISCGCFGQGEEPANYLWLILRNVGLLIAMIAVLIHDGRNPKRRCLKEDVPAS